MPGDPRLDSRPSPLSAAAVGAAAGLLTLGLGGRLAMALLALASGAPPGFSFGGSLEVLVVGTGYGALGGIIAWGLRRMLGLRSALRAGLAASAALLALAWLTSRSGRSAATGVGDLWPVAVALALACFLAFGLLLGHLLERRARAATD